MYIFLSIICKRLYISIASKLIQKAAILLSNITC